MIQMPMLQMGMEWGLRQLGWHPLFALNHNSPPWLAIVEAHPYHDFAPLGWQESLPPAYGSPLSASVGTSLLAPPGPSTSASTTPPRNFSARRDTPRPFDDDDDDEDTE